MAGSRNLLDTQVMTLASLQHGQKGVIRAIDTTDPTVQRLMVLGLVEGAEVEYSSSAIGGDPLEFRLFGNAISLRKEHAQHFMVSTLPNGG
jgi:ferrous iron transport protein A